MTTQDRKSVEDAKQFKVGDLVFSKSPLNLLLRSNIYNTEVDFSNDESVIVEVISIDNQQYIWINGDIYNWTLIKTGKKGRLCANEHPRDLIMYKQKNNVKIRKRTDNMTLLDNE